MLKHEPLKIGFNLTVSFEWSEMTHFISYRLCNQQWFIIMTYPVHGNENKDVLCMLVMNMTHVTDAMKSLKLPKFWSHWILN